MARKAGRWGNAPLVAIELLGFAMAFYLFLISARILYPESVPCPRGSIFACQSILRGPFSKFGPFSIAALGVIYFVAHLALTGLIRPKGNLLLIKFAGAIAGLAFVSYLRSIELLWLHKICPWCYGVALMVLVQVFVLLPMVSPPLPKLKIAQRLGAVVGLFALFILGGMGLAAALGKPERALAHGLIPAGVLPTAQSPAEEPKPAEIAPTPEPSPTPAMARTHTPRPAASPTPQPKMTANASPKELPRPADNALVIRESELDNEETRLLRRLGWRIPGEIESVNQAVAKHPPVLLVVFDPYCEECAHLIMKQLPDPEVTSLPVTKLAMEQAAMQGPLSAQVTHVPTILLIDKSGQVVFRHVGRIEPAALAASVRQALALGG
ncbi:MAG: hypothetical protein N2111_05495 [Candidatus Sumerlaeaceae bacterium]|nr:hypothetical protein [Candidatus Sumerlaeaceae bacterium]